MYLAGVSVRRVEDITEVLWGTKVSPGTVSRMHELVDRGDVILLSFDPTLWHEQAGFSPAVVLSREIYNKASGLCLVCPITTSVKGYPFKVALDGARKTSGVALADEVCSIDWPARKITIVDRISITSLTTILAKVKPFLS
jgi:mRNA interferase MazF